MDIHIYLSTHPTLWDEHIKFSEFKTFSKDLFAEIDLIADLKKRAWKKKKTSDISIQDSPPMSRQLSPHVKAFLGKVDWSIKAFIEEFRENITVIKATIHSTAVNECMQCLDKHLGHCLIIMSGLSWNVDSKNHLHDYVTIATAAALESAILSTYRNSLFSSDTCLDACALCVCFQEAFTSIILPFVTSMSDDSMNEWSFANGIHIAPSSLGIKNYDPITTNDALQFVLSSKASSKKFPIIVVVKYLEKNKYLACSKDGVPSETVEFSVHYLISLIIEVSYLEFRVASQMNQVK